jgi:hypothetical protein
MLEAMSLSCCAASLPWHGSVAAVRRTRSHAVGSRAVDALQAAHVGLSALTVAGRTHRPAAHVAPSRRATRGWQLAALEEGSEAKGTAADDDVTYEPMRKARAKGRLQAKVKVSTPTADAALGNAPPTEVARAETTAVLALTAVFSVFMIEGFLVASSGFMSEEWDGIVQARTHTALHRCFAPTARCQLRPAYRHRPARFRGRRTCCLPSHPRLACSWQGHPRMVRAWAYCFPSLPTLTHAPARATCAGVWKAYGQQQ